MNPWNLLPALPASDLAAVLITFLLAGTVKGIAGMGLPTVAMGVLGSLMPPSTAAALLIVPSFVTNVWQLIAGGGLRALFSRFWPLMAGIVAGTLATSRFLAAGDGRWNAFGLGIALIAYALTGLVRPHKLVLSPARERWVSLAVGALTGAISGTTGVFVIPAVPYIAALALPRDSLVQALGLAFTTSTVALAIGLSGHHALTGPDMTLSVIALLPALLGMWLGQRWRRRISAQLFRRGFMICLLLLGLQLAFRPWT